MEHKFTMSLSLNVLNHLGINLYSNVPAVLSEIVANSWDADAENVTIAISSDEIIIEDNGCGMTVSDINSHFLKVGYQKREDETASSKFKRRFMGRKGIGKLSMFSIAREVDVISRKTVGGVIESNALRMNIDKIADSIKNENINAERDYHPDVITEGYTPLEKDGTRIVLRQLKKNIFLSILGIQKSRWLFISSCFTSQLYPCQNSLSQKTATFFPTKTMSGFPKTVFTFFLYLSPRDHSSFRRATSIAESLFFTRLIL